MASTAALRLVIGGMDLAKKTRHGMRNLLTRLLIPFRSRRVAIGAGVIALVALLSAMVVGKGLGRLLALPEGVVLEEPQVATEEGASEEERVAVRSNRPKSKDSYTRPIIDRNIFDPDAVAVTSTGDEEGRLTDLELKLLATVLAIPAEYSSCLILGDGRNAMAQGYGVGGVLDGDSTIIRIEKKRVVIERSNGDIEYLEINEEETARPSRRRASTSEDGISADGDEVVVERSVIDEAIEDIDRLASQIRVVPHRGDDGSVDGYRLSAIRRGTIFDKLGIKNGDIVHEVNGQALTSTAEAMSAYQSLENDDSFSFDITRRNRRQTLQFQIR